MTVEQIAHSQSFLRLLVTAASNASLYSPEHQQVIRLCAAALTDLAEALGDGVELSFMLIDEEIIVNGTPLGNSMYLDRFSQTMKAHGISHLRVLRGVRATELKALVEVLARRDGRGEEVHSSDNVRYGRVDIPPDNKDLDQDHVDGSPLQLADIPAEELHMLMDIYEEARRHKRLNVVGISEIVSSFIDAFKQVADPLLALAPLRAMDEYTFTHSTNVCILNLAQAMALGIEGPLLNDIGMAAILHDIGKIFVPEEILTKPDKLDEAEWNLMKQHPGKGAQYLLEIPGIPRLAVVTAFEHHLKYNLTGYPVVAPGWQQNLCSQMTTVSDFFDALRTKRVYRGAIESEKVASIMMEQAGTELHPVLTRNFLSILNKISAPQT